MGGRSARALLSRWRRFGIRTRLMVAHVLLMTIVVGAVVATSDYLFQARLSRELNHDLREEGPEFANAAAYRPRDQTLHAFTVFYLKTHLRLSGLSLIIALDRQPAGRPDVLFSAHAAPLAASPAVSPFLTHATQAATLTSRTIEGNQYRVFATPISESRHRVATLVAIRNLAALNPDRRSELMIAALEGGLALLAAVLAGYLLLRRVLRVVSDVTDAAGNAAGGDLSRRLAYEGPDDELGHLARTVDTMLERLDQAFSAQRRLLSDVSHQLRTPLTVIRGHLEVLARDPDADADERAETTALVVDELEHVSLMVERLLLLGRALEPDFIEEGPIDVQTLLGDVADAAQHLAPRRWELDAGPPLVLRGDRTKLRGALLNLVDNAVNATGEADTIRVAASRDPGGNVVFEIADTGRGILLADQERLFERFSRSTDRYRGSGLGLAIVKAIADAHGARVEVQSAPGEGCRVRIVVPGDRVVSVPEEATLV